MNKLKEKRMQRELSQFQLAKASGVSLRMLQKYEQGDRDIKKAQAETVYKLAKVLNCQMEELIDIQKDLD
ncbi:helix-turn-helix transcriptional regulator [uncultured Eubacterium sp.]|uniref:helix-turn-helix domain-containing protein n=1 Tax=uncultured Eubacterium sp. TaxID=165185 RepID=UPI0026282B9B|nr:helix-turn-helix transcriptional regulator [uncultured Eubacterium sp.]